MGNRLTQAKAYLGFMLKFNYNVFHPQILDMTLYTQLLKNSCKSVQSVKNYISGARSYIIERGGDSQAFLHPMVVKLVKGFTRNSVHVPRQAAVVPIETFKRACRWLRELSVEGEVVAAALMFAYVTFLRQCHFCYTNTGSMHIIRRHDLSVYADRIIATIRSSKTTGNASPRVMTILATDGPICPVRMITQAMALVPASLNAPVFLDPRSAAPLDPHRTLDLFRLALVVTGYNKPDAITLHSLRRSGPQACVGAGVPIQEVADHGNWRSKAVYTYVPKQMSLVTPNAVKDLLFNKNGE